MARKTERKDTALAHKKSANAAYSSTPFGKVREGETLRDDEAEQSVLVRIRAMRAEGLPLRGIADRLNVEGVASKQGRIWHASTVGYILKHAA